MILGAGLSALLHGLGIAVLTAGTLSFWADSETATYEVSFQDKTPDTARPLVPERTPTKAPQPAEALQQVRAKAIGDTGFRAEVAPRIPDKPKLTKSQPGIVVADTAKADNGSPVDTASTDVARETPLSQDRPAQVLARMPPPLAAAARAARQQETRLKVEDAPRWQADTPAARQALERTAERYRHAAAAGRAFARYNLALAHLHGRGAEKDRGLAADQFEQSAISGYAPAMLRLAEAYLAGHGKPRDDIEGAAWYRVAAAIGSRAGQQAAALLDAHFGIEQRAQARERAVALQASLSVTRAHDWEKRNREFREAIDRGDVATAARLLGMGADGNITDAEGRSGLISAAWRGHAEIADLLLRAGVDPDSADNQGRNALMWASINGHAALVRLLLGSISTVDTRDVSGLTPLMRAAWNGHDEVVRELLRAGANAALRDDAGVSALERARMSGNPEVVRLLADAVRRG